MARHDSDLPDLRPATVVHATMVKRLHDGINAAAGVILPTLRSRQFSEHMSDTANLWMVIYRKLIDRQLPGPIRDAFVEPEARPVERCAQAVVETEIFSRVLGGDLQSLYEYQVERAALEIPLAQKLEDDDTIAWVALDDAVVRLIAQLYGTSPAVAGR